MLSKKNIRYVYVRVSVVNVDYSYANLHANLHIVTLIILYIFI